ncbi:transporter [Polynucleobacter necessarius]|uniref:transporter n=1 Tax=Polynucleobacter necessarius TaxID=576610 RepID=UPI0018D4DACB|nr:transporter [Polynucleobacter necessarius]
MLPYSELSTTKNLGLQNLNASAEGLSDPVIKFSANLYGAPALSEEEFKLYKQDLIIGAGVAASIPWGKYNNEQIVNVGGNRSLIKPGIGASQAIGAWRLEFAGMATIVYQEYELYGQQHPFAKPNLFD